MFLSKKNAAYLNKPPKGKEIKIRVLPGWNEDDEETQQQFQIDYTNQMKMQSKAKDPLDFGLLEENNTDDHQAQKQSNSRKIYYDWDELNEMDSIQCQKKLVQGIVEISGVRIKPNENMFAQFANQCKGMDPKYIGSLLMSKIQVNYSFPIKAKALYTIQYLVKKNPTYSNYFKAHSEKLQSFPEPQDNAENYRKILKSTLNTIGISVANQMDKQENKFNFEDPGYNNDTQTKKTKQLKTMIGKQKKQTSKKFISPAQMKKTTQKQDNNQIFQLISDNVNTSAKNNDFGLGDLILMDNTKQTGNNQNDMKFNDLLTNNQPNNNKSPPVFDFTL